MAKIIRFDPSRRQHEDAAPGISCDHKDVVAFTASRTVQCAICGAELEAFDVMLELLKGYIPPGENNRELKLFSRELERRHQERQPKRK